MTVVGECQLTKSLIVARKRVGKSRRETGEVVLKPAEMLPEPEIEAEAPPESIFDDDLPASLPNMGPGLFEDAPPVAIAPPSAIIAVERDLTPDQRAEFEALLNEKMGLKERASQLVRLAHMRGSKTAAVGLRAIMEINRITRVSDERPNEAPAMFQLPPGTNVSVTVEKVDK